MTASSTIRSAWDSAVMTHATVIAMTTAIFDYDIIQTLDKLAAAKASIRVAGNIDCITYVCNRAQVPGRDQIGSANGTKFFQHRVIVSRYLYADPDGTNGNQCIDDLQTIEGLVDSELGLSWSSNINYYNCEDVTEPEIVEIDGVFVWTATHTYIGVKYAQP